MDNTGDADGLACTRRSTDDYGTCTSVAIQFAPSVPVPLLAMYAKGITFQVSRADSRRYLPEVARLVTSGLMDPAAVPTTVARWEDADLAWLDPAIKLAVDRTLAAWPASARARLPACAAPLRLACTRPRRCSSVGRAGVL